MKPFRWQLPALHVQAVWLLKIRQPVHFRAIRKPILCRLTFAKDKQKTGMRGQ